MTKKIEMYNKDIDAKRKSLVEDEIKEKNSLKEKTVEQVLLLIYCIVFMLICNISYLGH